MPISSTLHPERYHGFSARPPFFEGWYYKLVSEDERIRFAIIPGVYLAQEHGKSHCFIQVFDSEADQVRFHRYPFQDFKFSKTDFEISIGPNTFSANKISLAIDDDLGQLNGSLTFDDLVPWPVHPFSPGAMGWFAWVPFMECYHGILSMDHTIQGHLVFDGRNLDLSDGRGYMEKDWGKKFPSAWIWGQSNHFPQQGVSVTLSVAVIPWIGWTFPGFIIGFWYDGFLHRFSTYLSSHIEDLTYDDSNINLVVRNATHRLRINAIRQKGGVLQAPTLNEMDRRIIETINAKIALSLEDLKGELIYEGLGRHAGLEVVGDVEKLLIKIR